MARLGIAPDYTAMLLERDHHGCAMQGICISLNLVFSHGETASPYTRFWHFRSIFRYFCVKMAGILSSVSGWNGVRTFRRQTWQPELRD